MGKMDHTADKTATTQTILRDEVELQPAETTVDAFVAEMKLGHKFFMQHPPVGR